MPRNRCPHCERMLPYAARRCVHCGWSVRAEMSSGGGVRWWRRRPLWGVIIVAALLLGLGMGYRNAPRLAGWYAVFAAENLPSAASSFAPAETEDGAYFYCVRQVARRMEGEFSVETFAGPQQSELATLGGGRYRIASFVDETREDGRRVRYEFVCHAAFQRGRWLLEQLDLSERFATPIGAGPALAVRES